MGGSIPPLNAFPTSFHFPLPESTYTFAFQPFGTVDPKLRSPYVEAWNFGIQQKFPGNNLLKINDVGNHVVRSWLLYDLNEVNIFENGFLDEFKHVAANLAINERYGYGVTFADNTGVPGLTPLPIFDTAFAGLAPSAGFANPLFVTLLQQGQAGALARNWQAPTCATCWVVPHGSRHVLARAGRGPIRSTCFK